MNWTKTKKSPIKQIKEPCFRKQRHRSAYEADIASCSLSLGHPAAKKSASDLSRKACAAQRRPCKSRRSWPPHAGRTNRTSRIGHAVRRSSTQPSPSLSSRRSSRRSSRKSRRRSSRRSSRRNSLNEARCGAAQSSRRGVNIPLPPNTQYQQALLRSRTL